ncbi:hypothetical protein ACO0K9_13860 [Undibacterium sp. Ji50W]|uniref:hypothetical protein n=1 Tax=Undibacterium sp. Ji50W TaxID=3413041 RepID=UPI003BF2C846
MDLSTIYIQILCPKKDQGFLSSWDAIGAEFSKHFKIKVPEFSESSFEERFLLRENEIDESSPLFRFQSRDFGDFKLIDIQETVFRNKVPTIFSSEENVSVFKNMVDMGLIHEINWFNKIDKGKFFFRHQSQIGMSKVRLLEWFIVRSLQDAISRIEGGKVFESLNMKISAEIFDVALHAIGGSGVAEFKTTDGAKIYEYLDFQLKEKLGPASYSKFRKTFEPAS